MRLNVLLLVISFIQFSFVSQEVIGLKKIFLDLKLENNIYDHFSNIEQDPNFELEFSRDEFMASALFRAKYLGESKLYSDADSLEISVITCNNMNVFLKYGESKCIEVTIFYYPDSEKSIDEEYDRINQVVKNAIILKDSKWKNHYGAGRGIYFLTGNDTPFIAIDKHTYRKDYITVSHYLEMN